MIAGLAPLRAPMNHACKAARGALSGGFTLEFCSALPVIPAQAGATNRCFPSSKYAGFPVVTTAPP